ncbi:MAG: rRNA maturation RNase YbeY [Anaerolineaceae bacterium]|nr:rRNA maturation RNase YbeY [Anaerolineaceae bacterium]MBN2677045.1 rRNA maturation RNase YbeY [Anaerolineaceae bacterium]
MIHIQVEKEYWSNVKTAELRMAAKTACSIAGLPTDKELTIVITDDDQVRELNAEFRQNNETTDVLSFPSNETDPDTGKSYLGDIIISYPRACQQATKAGHTCMNELVLLVIHGILHLANHDHANDAEKKVMFDLQKKALAQLNISIKGYNP